METTEKSDQHAVQQSQEAQSTGDLELKMSPDEEKRLLRHIDIWMVPYASLIYLLSFLDRVNIGQARLAGLEKDLRLHGNQYDIALTIFFVSYIVSMGLVKNAKALYATSGAIVNPISEQSGLFPGFNFLFTTWYTRKELNGRVSLFSAGATLAGAFGGLLAFGIRHMTGIGDKGGWAWIFILEGLLTLVCAIPAPWLVQDFPQYRSYKCFFTVYEEAGVEGSDGLEDMVIYVASAIVQSSYAFSLFAPSIIAALGFTNATANALSAAPYVMGTVVMLTVARISDRLLMRSPIIVIMMLFPVVGYTILLCDVSPTVKYVAVFMAVAGVNTSSPTGITFVGNNTTFIHSSFGPMYTRAAVMGVFFSFGNCGGVISSNIYPIGDAPKYIRGHTIGLAFSCLAIVLSAIMGFYNMQENARRDKIYGVPNLDGGDCDPLNADDPMRLKKWGLQGMSKQEIIGLGDQHPAFRSGSCCSIQENTYSIYIVIALSNVTPTTLELGGENQTSIIPQQAIEPEIGK
ncbi:putative MFS nicotinic acid transporter Tna1 [Hysterangium stoloniferum]|nr:putative MFS nicotinic acid transporter Tna1 [Hysterangium stoloniferum]